MKEVERMDKITIAYVAGFFDADGSVSYHSYRATKNGKRYWRLQAKVTQKYPEVLYWIKEQFGVGTVGSRASGHSSHDFVVTHRAARLFLNTILPYIKVKKEKVLECLELDKERKRENPTTGNSWMI